MSWRGRYERSIEVALFVPVIFRQVRWDWPSIFNILGHWFHRMRKCHEMDDMHEQMEVRRIVRELKLAERLCKRIAADNYDIYWGKGPTFERDTDRLFRLVRRYVRKWWM